jgi:hypothetical protein
MYNKYASKIGEARGSVVVESLRYKADSRGFQTTSCSATQQFNRLLCNPKIHYRV